MDRAPVFFDSRGLMLPFLRRRWTLSFTVTTNFRPNSSGRRTYLWVGGFSGSSFNSPGYFKSMCIPMKFLEVEREYPNGQNKRRAGEMVDPVGSCRQHTGADC